nr:2-C-methyl-D-erythritol 4-phosphate cytidylyltransferase [Spelaeicoccus albus]
MPKALVEIDGEPMIVRAVRNAAAAGCTGTIVVVAPDGHLEQFAALVGQRPIIVAGGAERTNSVAAGLAALPPDIEIVLVHDAARAGAPPELFDAVAQAVCSGPDAVVPGLPVPDTIKYVDADGTVTDTPDRAFLRAVQTPQGFRRAALERAHRSGRSATDDAALVERLGGRSVVIDGDLRAMKVTTRADLDAVERLVAHESAGPTTPQTQRKCTT